MLHLITLNDTHIHTLGRTHLDEGSARRRGLYLTTHTTQKRQASMYPVGFEPAIPAIKLPQIHVFRPQPLRLAYLLSLSQIIVQMNVTSHGMEMFIITVTSYNAKAFDVKLRM
jgi:hypothetical protein